MQDFDDEDDFEGGAPPRSFEGIRARFRELVDDAPLQKSRVDIAAIRSVERATGSEAPGQLLAKCRVHELSHYWQDAEAVRSVLNPLAELPSARDFFEGRAHELIVQWCSDGLIGEARISGRRISGHASIAFGYAALDADDAAMILMTPRCPMDRIAWALMLPVAGGEVTAFENVPIPTDW